MNHSAAEGRSFCQLLAFVAVFSFAVAGCAHRTSTNQPPAPVPTAQPAPSASAPSPASGAPPAVEKHPAIPGEYVEEGMASWYGNPFDGRRTSNGEVYDMHEFTAAHRTLPFGAIVRVTNLANGKQIEIRVNDRGPFVANRIIDLSEAAAQAIQMIGPGTAMVRLEVVSGPNPQTGFFCVQIGAFRLEENAERLKSQIESRYTPIAVVPFETGTGKIYRVRIGRIASEDEARQLAAQLHTDERLITFVVRLDE